MRGACRYVSVNFRIRDETTVYLCIECHVCELILTLTEFGVVQVSFRVCTCTHACLPVGGCAISLLLRILGYCSVSKA